MSAIVEHARAELARIGGEDDEMQQMMNEHIIRMVETFADEGHSGFSAGYAIGLLEKLLRFEPLGPLTGEDDEWTEVGDGVFQNRRCSHVFKDATGAYDIAGRIFEDEDGCRFTNRESRVYVTFPYTPTREIVKLGQP